MSDNLLYYGDNLDILRRYVKNESVDLIYLDDESRVLHLEESFGTFRIGPVRTNCASVLELPTRTIYSSHTQVGDQLLIGSAEAMEESLKPATPEPMQEAAMEGGGSG